MGAVKCVKVSKNTFDPAVILTVSPAANDTWVPSDFTIIPLVDAISDVLADRTGTYGSLMKLVIALSEITAAAFDKSGIYKGLVDSGFNILPALGSSAYESIAPGISMLFSFPEVAEES